MRAVLTYHSIDSSESAISVGPADFERHMRWLGQRSVPVVPLQSVLDPGEGDRIAITFDDGYRNFEETALPLLREYGLPATLFVATRQVGSTSAWPGKSSPAGIPELPLLDWRGVSRVASQGIEIGAHSQTHARLSGLSPSRLQQEVDGCREDIRRELGIVPASFCYPYGDVSPAVRSAIGSASFQLAVTTEMNAVGAGVDPLMIPRIDMYYLRESTMLESWGTPRFARHLLVRRAARGIRRAAAASLRWRR